MRGVPSNAVARGSRSGLLFLAILFAGVVTSSVLVEMGATGTLDAQALAFGSGVTNGLVPGNALRMAAVFTLSVSTLGLRTRAMPRWLVLVWYAVALVLLIAPDGLPEVAFLFLGWVLIVSVALLLIGSAADQHRLTDDNVATDREKEMP